MKPIATLSLVLPCLCLVWVTAGCDSHEDDDVVDRNDIVVSEDFDESIEFDGQDGLSLAGINGQIDVRGVPAAETIRIAGRRKVGSESTEDARVRLQYLAVEIDQIGNEIHVRTVQPEDSRGRNYTIDYDISLPPQMRVSVGNVNGTVHTEGIRGTLDVSVVNGQIDCLVPPEPGSATALALVNGVVRLDLPSAGPADVTAQLVNGLIVADGLSEPDTDPSPSRFRAILGDGGPSMGVSVVNGQILLTGY